jgi:hypothetical protein
LGPKIGPKGRKKIIQPQKQDVRSNSWRRGWDRELTLSTIYAVWNRNRPLSTLGTTLVEMVTEKLKHYGK